MDQRSPPDRCPRPLEGHRRELASPTHRAQGGRRSNQDPTLDSTGLVPRLVEATLPPGPLLQPRGASSCAAPQLTDRAAGDLPDQIKRAQVDVTEKAGRPGPRGSILPGAAQNADAARNPPEEMTASPTLLEEGRSFPASPTAGHGGYGADLVKATGPAP
jgi:hypothetical protein